MTFSLKFASLLTITFFLIVSSDAAIWSKPYFPTTKTTVLVAFGGITSANNTFTDDVDIICLSNNQHNNLTKLPNELYEFGNTVLNNTMYIMGGMKDDKSSVDSFISYNFRATANDWTYMNSFPVDVKTNALAAVGNTVFSFGGWAIGYGDITYTYAYDLDGDGIWLRVAPLPESYLTRPKTDSDSAPYVVVLNQTDIYFFDLGNLYRSNDGAKTWTQLRSMGEKVIKVSITSLNVDGGLIFVAGGQDRRNATVYCVASDTWKQLSPMRKERSNAAAVALSGESNQVAVCGGNSADYAEYYSDCEIYDWKTGGWGAAPFSLNMPRAGYGLKVLDSVENLC